MYIVFHSLLFFILVITALHSSQRRFFRNALHSSMMHRFSQGSFAEMAASIRMIPRIPSLPMEDIESMGGKFLSGKVTATSGEDRKSTRLNSSHSGESRMPSSA